jgi:hypothetical protein
MCPSFACAQLRSEANKRAAQAVREASHFAARMGDDMTGPSPSKRPRTEAGDAAALGNGAPEPDCPPPDCLTPEEEQIILEHYLKMYVLDGNPSCVRVRHLSRSFRVLAPTAAVHGVSDVRLTTSQAAWRAPSRRRCWDASRRNAELI